MHLYAKYRHSKNSINQICYQNDLQCWSKLWLLNLHVQISIMPHSVNASATTENKTDICKHMITSSKILLYLYTNFGKVLFFSFVKSKLFQQFFQVAMVHLYINCYVNGCRICILLGKKQLEWNESPVHVFQTCDCTFSWLYHFGNESRKSVSINSKSSAVKDINNIII